MKILLVEDNPDLSETVVSYLRQEGYICESAPDYQTADDKIGVYRYDIIVLDITLPDGSGLDLLKKR